MNLTARCLRSSLLLAVAGALFACSSPAPTTGTLAGTVTLTGATDASGTLVSAGGQVVATGTDGHFLLSNLAPGAVQVSAAHDGYISQQQSVTIVAGKQATATLTLKPVIPGPVLNSLAANPPVVAPGGTLQLTADVSAAASDTLTYAWTVPAGWTQSGTGASITLQAPAQYGQSALVGLKVTDAQGLSVEGHVIVSTVGLGGVKITSLTAVPPQVAPGGHIQLEALATDLSGAALTYQWTAPAGWSFQEASTTKDAVLVAPATYGTFGTVSVTVTGAAGATATAQAVVGTLPDRAPVIQSLLALDPLPVLPGSSVRVAVTAADPDGDALSYAWTSTDPAWTISGTGATVSITAPATANNTSTQVSVVVSDGVGGTTLSTIALASSGCPANRRNCDGVAANGCEANLYDSTSCGACGNSCATGTYCGAQTACIPLGTSCEAIREAGNSKGDGIYWIQPLGATAPYAAWCDMTTDGGGWTAFYSGLNGEPNQFAHFYMKTRVCPDPASQCLQPMPASTAHTVQIQATCGASKVAFFGNDSTYDYFAAGGFDNWSTMTQPVSLDGTSDGNLATQFYLGNNNTYSGWIITGNNEDGASTFASSVEDAEYNYCNGVPDRSSPIRLMYRQQVDHLQIDIAPAIALGSGTFTVTAMDSQNQAVPEYLGTVHFSSTDASLALPADYTFTADDLGTHVFTFPTPVSGQYPITVTDTAHATLTATVTAYVGAQKLTMQGPTIIAENTPITVTLNALDALGNLVAPYAGTVHFTSSDATNLPAPADYTFTAADGGSHSFSLPGLPRGAYTLTATDAANATLTATLTLYVGAQKLLVKPPPLVAPNQSFTFTVQALDGASNPVPSYTGTVHFTFSDTAATAPSDYTFQPSDNGTASITVTLVTAGHQTITVTDTTASSVTGTATVAVSTGPGTASNPASSCLQILQADNTLADGRYTLTDGTTPYAAYCDMTYDGGGWTLYMSLPAQGSAPTPGPVLPGTSSYMPGGTLQALANVSSQVHIRTTGEATTRSVTSAPNTAPIINLRNLRLLDNYGPVLSNWTGPMVSHLRTAGCNPPASYPRTYWACGNSNGLHIMPAASDGATWRWSVGTGVNENMEVYVR